MIEIPSRPQSSAFRGISEFFFLMKQPYLVFLRLRLSKRLRATDCLGPSSLIEFALIDYYSIVDCRAKGIGNRQANNEAVGGFFSEIGDLNVVHHLWGKNETADECFSSASQLFEVRDLIFITIFLCEPLLLQFLFVRPTMRYDQTNEKQFNENQSIHM